MASEQLAFLTLAILVVAFLYSSVGHAGASGYIAVMSLFGLAPAVIKPTALILNFLVACIGAWQFWRAGHFSWRLFWPFAVEVSEGLISGTPLRLILNRADRLFRLKLTASRQTASRHGQFKAKSAAAADR